MTTCPLRRPGLRRIARRERDDELGQLDERSRARSAVTAVGRFGIESRRWHTHPRIRTCAMILRGRQEGLADGAAQRPTRDELDRAAAFSPLFFPDASALHPYNLLASRM